MSEGQVFLSGVALGAVITLVSVVLGACIGFWQAGRWWNR